MTMSQTSPSPIFIDSLFRTGSTWLFDRFMLRSYLGTLRKQGVDLLRALVQSFQGKTPQPTMG